MSARMVHRVDGSLTTKISGPLTQAESSPMLNLAVTILHRQSKTRLLLEDGLQGREWEGDWRDLEEARTWLTKP